MKESGETKGTIDPQVSLKESGQAKGTEDPQVALKESGETKGTIDPQVSLKESGQAKGIKDSQDPLKESGHAKGTKDSQVPLTERGETKGTTDSQVPLKERKESGQAKGTTDPQVLMKESGKTKGSKDHQIANARTQSEARGAEKVAEDITQEADSHDSEDPYEEGGEDITVLKLSPHSKISTDFGIPERYKQIYKQQKQKTYSGRTPCVLDGCPKMLSNLPNMWNHFRCEHLKIILCEECEKRFRSTKGFNNHPCHSKK